MDGFPSVRLAVIDRAGEPAVVMDLSSVGFGLYEIPIGRIHAHRDSGVELSLQTYSGPPIESFPIQTVPLIQIETGRVHRRVITESTERGRRPPACRPMPIAKLEIGNIAEGECSICLDDFSTEMDVCVTVPCEHVFHKDCLMRWLEENNVCPLCRCQFMFYRCYEVFQCN